MLELSVKNLSHQFPNGEKLYEDISFTLKSGEILGILGANGTGKSTLLKTVLGLVKVQAGEVMWNPAREKVTIAYLPQHTSFNTYLNLTVKDILYLAPHRDKNIEAEVIQEFHLDKILNRLFKFLSGGERQRVLMAMHSLSRPQIWFLDEPNKGLDSAGQDQMYQLLKKFAVEKQTPILIIDHNINQTLSLCDQILCLNRTGHYHSKKEMMDHQKVHNLYHCEFEHQLIHNSPEQWGKQHEHHHDHSSEQCQVESHLVDEKEDK